MIFRIFLIKGISKYLLFADSAAIFFSGAKVTIRAILCDTEDSSQTKPEGKRASYRQNEVLRGALKKIFCLCLSSLLLLSCNSSNQDSKNQNGIDSQDPKQILGQRLRDKVQAQRLLGLVETQVNFGPRPNQSEALAQCREWMIEELRSHGWKVVPYSFQAKTSLGERTFTNIRARFGNGADLWEKPVGTLYGTHYETKLFTDIEFLGANDGGSGTAVLLELARVLGQDPDGRKIAEGLEIVFFDGEEAFKPSIEKPTALRRPLTGEGLWGSRNYALNVVDGIFPAPGRVVIWDIVGDPNTPLYLDINHLRFSALLNDINQAAKIVRKKHIPVNNYRKQSNGDSGILDDHTPFEMLNTRSNPKDPLGLFFYMPAADVIQLDLFGPRAKNSYWHTAEDTLDKVSGEQLAETTKIALQLLLELD